MTSTQLPHHRHLLKRLENEWMQLCVRHNSLHSTCRGWNLPGGAPSSLGEVLTRSGHRPDPRHGPAALAATPVDYESVDAVLLQLLIVAKTDQLAGRVVLQRMLPGLVAIARRKSYTLEHRIDLLDELVANAWSVISRYPTDRRPRKVMANLLLDTSFETFVRPTRLRSSTEVARPPDAFEDNAAEYSTEPIDELVEVLTDARDRGVTQADVDLLFRFVNNARPETVAAEMNVTARTVRNYRQAAIDRVRQVMVAA